MSRVLLVSLDEGEVVARCLAAKVSISVIDGLPSGGTRFVCASVDGAAHMRKVMKSEIIAGPITSAVYRQGRRPL